MAKLQQWTLFWDYLRLKRNFRSRWKNYNKPNSRSWQRSIGVPQHIFLGDDTIASNIAFGVDRKNVKQKAIEKVSKIANLHNFILDELPSQYQTTIGERGVRLSQDNDNVLELHGLYIITLKYLF